MTNVLLPLIRRVMPTIIANTIIGVSPMFGPAGSIFDMRDTSKFSLHVVMNKTHYGHFLRVYNRRTRHTADYITELGYQRVRVSRRYLLYLEAEQWCRDNLKVGSYVSRLGHFWFAYNEDAVLFKMRWA